MIAIRLFDSGTVVFLLRVSPSSKPALLTSPHCEIDLGEARSAASEPLLP
jgi:hypothetical protein